ncbi:AAA family ATPase [Streptomyces sp. f51]|uniref:AAA family ATPase n=1 Tax=Streptomyces sp. f51 TaxID=1827742 RepID=UPI000BF00075|nr:AAA family ATPase [Streptomyces sp. f51]
MQFAMLEYSSPMPDRPGAYLISDGWNDGGFITTFELQVRLADMQEVRIGYVRICHVSMRSDGVRRTADLLPLEFTTLDDGFFSLAHEDDYYERLRELPVAGMGREILRALNDVALGRGVDSATRALDVYKKSLLRGRTEQQLSMANYIASGMRSRVVPFVWQYTPAQDGLLPPHRFEFEATPGSRPPTNLHALIGRNGVGKSTLLHRLAEAATEGRITVESQSVYEDSNFTGCVVVSFSPFDRPYGLTQSAGFPLHYIGLRHAVEQRLKTEDEWRTEFIDSFATARIGARGDRWRDAIGTLNYSASGFLDEHMPVIDRMIREGSSRKFAEGMGEIFNSLSSGHAVVLLMVTRLIELVGERTLVLIDEPETHLHPPLLSALTRALSDVLSDRNGMAVVATHSPVVLQEVPASCVWMMTRHGDELTAHRPTMETYGESVGELTYEAFGLEVDSTGFHAAIAAEVDRGGTYEEIASRFTGLGREARALLRAMTFARARGAR